MWDLRETWDAWAFVVCLVVGSGAGQSSPVAEALVSTPPNLRLAIVRSASLTSLVSGVVLCVCVDSSGEVLPGSGWLIGRVCWRSSEESWGCGSVARGFALAPAAWVGHGVVARSHGSVVAMDELVSTGGVSHVLLLCHLEWWPWQVCI